MKFNVTIGQDFNPINLLIQNPEELNMVYDMVVDYVRDNDNPKAQKLLEMLQDYYDRQSL